MRGCGDKQLTGNGRFHVQTAKDEKCMGMQTRWFESIPIYLKPMRFSEIRGVSKWYLPNTIIFYSVWKIRPLNKYF